MTSPGRCSPGGSGSKLLTPTPEPEPEPAGTAAALADAKCQLLRTQAAGPAAGPLVGNTLHSAQRGPSVPSWVPAGGQAEPGGKSQQGSQRRYQNLSAQMGVAKVGEVSLKGLDCLLRGHLWKKHWFPMASTSDIEPLKNQMLLMASLGLWLEETGH